MTAAKRRIPSVSGRKTFLARKLWQSTSNELENLIGPSLNVITTPSCKRVVRHRSKFAEKIVRIADFSREINSPATSILVSAFFARSVKEVTRFFGEVVRAVGSPSTDSSRSMLISSCVRSALRCTLVTLDVDHCIGFDERLKCWNGRWLRRGARRISRFAHATALHQNVILTGQGHRPKRDHQKQIRHVRLRALAVDHVALF